MPFTKWAIGWILLFWILLAFAVSVAVDHFKNRVQPSGYYTILKAIKDWKDKVCKPIEFID